MILLSLFLTTGVLAIITLILANKGFAALSNRTFLIAKVFFAATFTSALYFQFTSKKER